MRLCRLALTLFCFTLLAGSSLSFAAGPAPKPLSPTERARLKDVVLSIGKVTSLAADYAVRPGVPPHSFFTMFLAPVEGENSPLKKVIDESDCQKTIHYPDEQPPLKAGENTFPVFSIDVSGAGCPVTYHASVDGTQLQNGLHANLNFKYSALTDEARKTSDVDSSDLHGVMEVSATQTPDGQSNMTINLDFGGTGHSQKEGDYSMGDKLAGSISISFGKQPPGGQPAPPPGSGGGFPSISISGEMDEISTFGFHGIVGELTNKTSILGMGQQTVDYRINGVAVSEKEYKELHDSLKLPGLQSGGPGGPQPASPYTLSCTSRVYPGQAMPVATLQHDLDQGHLPAMPGLSEFRSCSDAPKKDSNITQMGTGRMETMFDFSNPAFAKAQMRYCEGTRCQAVQRFYLPNETKGFAETLGDYSVLTFCAPAKVCH